MNKIDSLLEECAECLRVIRALRHNELDPRVVQELHAILHQLELLLAQEANISEVPPSVWDSMITIITKAAQTIGLVKRIFDSWAE